MKKYLTILAAAAIFASCGDKNGGEGNGNDNGTTTPNAYVEWVRINGQTARLNGSIGGIEPGEITIEVAFSKEIDMAEYDPEKVFMSTSNALETIATADPKILALKVTGAIVPLTGYKFYIQSGDNLGLKIIDSYTYGFSTAPPDKPQDPEISDDELVKMVQERTFKYFWDYAHPTSGLARERTGSGNTVTTGGSGFGLMGFPVAVERGFVTRDEALERSEKIVGFLKNRAERFHGAYSHWLNGQTGKVIPFGTKDNGADLVETAFLIQGLLTLQTYFDGANDREQALRDDIQSIWEGVDWDWFRRDGQNVLYWHWSPNYGWDMNMRISGWNEALIVYVLAASSPTHPIPKEVYTEGWARNGAMHNGREFYDVTLPLGENYGGPMFFAHYSFLGLDPRNLSDEYANYWDQVVAHATINYKYCVANPKGYAGYSAQCWGLTASDIPNGYTASSPTNDRGVIAPTAAVASMPYTPEESMAAMSYFYHYLGSKLWGEYGFRDAFSLTQNWFAPSYLAIDQGPIVVMLENHRTGLVWDLFMSRTDIQAGLTKLGFTYTAP